MHYMPWFDTPEHNGYWGWHWTMNNRNPDNIIDPQTGKREIAAHYYPLIGPYASKDPDVIEYHLLLMKYSGVDAVLINWYGVEGRNGDINSLLTNSNALIDRVDEAGLEFAIMLEDRFADSLGNTRANMAYAASNYFPNPQYHRYGANQEPLLPVFGPITFEQESDWDSIAASAGEDIVLLPLWYQRNDMGRNADGEFCWIYEDDAQNDYYQRLERFYQNRAPSENVSMGVVYPGFKDFYAQGGSGNNLFSIPHDHTLDSTLSLARRFDSDIDLLEIATWDDIGKGTMVEPTLEFGFDFLVALQQWLGVNYGEAELQQIHRLYLLRKKYAGDPSAQSQLDQVFDHFVNLRVQDAIDLMAVVDGTVALEGVFTTNQARFFPNPATGMLRLENLSPQVKTLCLIDVHGRSHLLTIDHERVDTKTLDAGLYTVQVDGNNLGKVLIQ
jgi:hypothetical protein